MVRRALSRLRRFGPEQSGAALIEFAVALPLLLIVALAVVDTTRYVWLSTDLSRAVDAGARLAAAMARANPDGVTTTAAATRVRALIQDAKRTEGLVTVAYLGAGEARRVRITLSQYPFTVLTPGVQFFVPGSQRLQVQAEFRIP